MKEFSSLDFWRYSFPLVLTSIFFLFLYQVIAYQPLMFIKKHGRRHALTGFAYLMIISCGFSELILPTKYSVYFPSYLAYDTALGACGIILTRFAASEFQHKNVKNFASGTLDQHATVTYGEMIEHSFYQGVNLAQAVFLHVFALGLDLQLWQRLVLLFLVTLPWYWRSTFPINKFSDNYYKIDDKSTPLIRFLYHVKKYQYVFYKHFLLHGLNITVAILSISMANERYFRIFWMLLNTSYVMEFFLQTLVKKDYMSQDMMLALQKILMLASTIAAVNVLQVVSIPVALASMFLNFTNRKYDVLNTMLVGIGYALVHSLFVV